MILGNFFFLAVELEKKSPKFLKDEPSSFTNDTLNNSLEEESSLTLEKNETFFERRVRFAPDDQLVSIRYFVVERDTQENATLHPHRNINASRDLDREEGRQIGKQSNEFMLQTIPWRKPNCK